MRRLHLYTAREVATPAFFALFVTTFLLFTSQLLRIGEAVFGQGLSAVDFVAILALLFPRFLVFTVPISVLVGVVAGLGRMSDDAEILALESAGMSVASLWPGPIGLGLVAALGTALPETLGFRPSQNSINRVAELLKTDQARHEFGAIIKFMTGLDPDLVTDPDEREQPSRVRCLALLYRGHDAIRKVRAILGTHDPRTAADGTVRSEFGFDFMQNGAHASATPEDVVRERKIIGIYPEGPSTVVPLIKAYLVRQ